MQFKTLALVLVLSVPLAASAQTIIPATTYGPGQPPVVVFSTPVLTTNGNVVTVSPGATVIYQSGTSVALEPGFHASAGGNFYVAIGNTVDTDGDGIPDVWERAYGLNPNNAADASALSAAGGMTNLQEYRAGLYPLVLQLSAAPLPAGYQLVLLTPGNRLYAINTSSWQISQVPAPP